MFSSFLPKHKKILNKKWPILNQRFKNMERGTAPCPDLPQRRETPPSHTHPLWRLKPCAFGAHPSLHKILNMPHCCSVSIKKGICHVKLPPKPLRSI